MMAWILLNSLRGNNHCMFLALNNSSKFNRFLFFLYSQFTSVSTRQLGRYFLHSLDPDLFMFHQPFYHKPSEAEVVSSVLAVSRASLFFELACRGEFFLCLSSVERMCVGSGVELV